MRLKFVLLVICIAIVANLGPTSAQSIQDDVYLAYVQDNIVRLADRDGMPIAAPGPTFDNLQSANLFWSADGDRLFVARSDGLFQTNANGSPAVRLPGNFGITMLYDRSGDIVYYMETSSPADAETAELVTFPLRELNTNISEGGTGRLIAYVGEYSIGPADSRLYGASLTYARDGGLLGSGRPRIFPTFGSTMFYTCCFPNAGLNAIDLGSGEKRVYDPIFIAGAAALNSTYSRLAGPTTEGSIRVHDLLTAGIRDYTANVGNIERVAWSLDDSALYFTSRAAPNEAIELSPIVTTPIDTQSANILVWRLDLATGRLEQLAELGDYYGVSSIAVTYDYVFVVVVERNTRLVNDLNGGRLPQDISITDERLMTDYVPSSILFRITPDGSESLSLMANVWGVAARPRR
jgi:hypothetical protein